MIEAQDHLKQLKAAEYNNYKPKDKSQYHKYVFDRAYPNQEKKIVNTHEDLMKALRR